MNQLFRIVGVLSLGAAAAMAAVRAESREPQAGSRVPVVAELFTSEGCSSCPAADDLLRKLIESQPIDGVEVLALSSHVDYWDRLGWRDPFSSPFFSARQSAYSADVFRTDNIYTPQLVVDGSLEAIGSDATAVRRALLAAAKRPKAMVAVSAAAEGDRAARIDVRVDVPESLAHTAADIVVAVTENGLVTQVKRGENGGRTLLHDGVVRSLMTAGRIDAASRTGSATATVALAPEWKLANLRFVGFVQEKANHRILGAGASALPQAR